MPLSRPALHVLAALQVVVLLTGVSLARWSDPAPAPTSGATAAAVDRPTPLSPATVRPVSLAPPEPAARADRSVARTRAAAVSGTSLRAAAASPLQQRGERALHSLAYDWQALGYAVQFRPYTGGTLGTTNRRGRLITIYVKRGQSELSLQATIAHELGHALDFTHGTEQRREQYRKIRGLSSSSAWFPCSRCDDLSSPAGDFAESFAVWLVGPGDFHGRLRPAPTAAELRQLARLFALPVRAAARPPAPAPRPTASPTPSEHQPALVVVLPGARTSPEPDQPGSAAV